MRTTAPCRGLGPARVSADARVHEVPAGPRRAHSGRSVLGSGFRDLGWRRAEPARSCVRRSRPRPVGPQLGGLAGTGRRSDWRRTRSLDDIDPSPRALFPEYEEAEALEPRELEVRVPALSPVELT